jgi:hypothetical protein
MNRAVCVQLVLLLFAQAALAQGGFVRLAGESRGEERNVVLLYGNQRIALSRGSTRVDYRDRKRESLYGTEELPSLRMRVVSGIVYLNDHPVLQHQIELSSTRRLTQDLTLCFPVKSLERFDRIILPLKNGVLYDSLDSNGGKIASYRCAGRSEKYAHDIALPLVICAQEERGTAVLTDPYFTSLFDRGIIRWTYPKEVGLEESVETRTIIEIERVQDMDEAMNMY